MNRPRISLGKFLRCSFPEWWRIRFHLLFPVVLLLLVAAPVAGRLWDMINGQPLSAGAEAFLQTLSTQKVVFAAIVALPYSWWLLLVRRHPFHHCSGQRTSVVCVLVILLHAGLAWIPF